MKRKRPKITDLRAIIHRLEMDKQQLRDKVEAHRHATVDARVVLLRDSLRQSEEIRTLLRTWLFPPGAKR